MILGDFESWSPEATENSFAKVIDKLAWTCAMSVHRELWIRSCVDLAVVMPVTRFVKCFVWCFDSSFVFL